MSPAKIQAQHDLTSEALLTTVGPMLDRLRVTLPEIPESGREAAKAFFADKADGLSGGGAAATLIFTINEVEYTSKPWRESWRDGDDSVNSAGINVTCKVQIGGGESNGPREEFVIQERFDDSGFRISCDLGYRADPTLPFIYNKPFIVERAQESLAPLLTHLKEL